MIFMMIAGFPQNHLIIGTYGVSDSSNLHDTTMALSFGINTKFHGVIRNQPDSWKITQNYPNPFNPVTTIQYEVARESRIRLKLYDITGREINTLVDEVKPAGEYGVSFDASGLPSGVYIYRIEADKFNESKKLILLR